MTYGAKTDPETLDGPASPVRSLPRGSLTRRKVETASLQKHREEPDIIGLLSRNGLIVETMWS